ncbi:BLUF domain-containing protein [Antarcticibacterium arcticum]|uniref:BLUF domain-containing protein n=1 Tax=Antarcticibacterium arcticum TaxID=2585771 RepID=A0A5B8YE21_9FLAO|nr:BLUF domain-containing protein [Antarcticibacterium arcticum]QED36212.1 BLUF domain-containing protein [Antarcticibacterium arcticum]
MRYAICYVSTAKADLEKPEVENLLDYTSNFNNSHDIRGVLLYSEGNFFQILEGDKKFVLELFDQIQKDNRHHNIIQVLGKDLKQGAFDGFKAEIVTSRNKYDYELVKEYMEQVEGLDPQTQQTVKRILEVFIDTR